MTKTTKILIGIAVALATICIALGVTLFVNIKSHNKETAPTMTSNVETEETSTTVDTTTSTTTKKTTTSTTTTTETTTTVATTTATPLLFTGPLDVDTFYSDEYADKIILGYISLNDPNSTLNIRKLPDINSDVIYTIKNHMPVEYIPTDINGFYAVRPQNPTTGYTVIGYAAKEYVREGDWAVLFPDEHDAWLAEYIGKNNNSNSNNSYGDTSLNDVVRFHADNPLLIYGDYEYEDTVMYEISDIRYRIERGDYDGQYKAIMTSYTIKNVGDVQVLGYPGTADIYVYDSFGNCVGDFMLDSAVTALPYGETRTSNSSSNFQVGYLVEGDYYIQGKLKK